MALEARLLQKLSQSLLMTPQLQQAIKLLQLGRLEFIEAIDQELKENPILEMDESASNPSEEAETGADPAITDLSEISSEAVGTEHPEQSEPKSDWADYLESYSDTRGMSTPRGLIDHEDRPSIDSLGKRTTNLSEHLMQQLRMSDLSKDDETIALHILGNLNKDGYLCLSYEEISQACSCNISDVERVIEVFRLLDPPGLAARDLKECLLLQLECLGQQDSLSARIVRDHMDKLERHKYEAIAKEEKVSLEAVSKAIGIIQHLEPRPARQFGDDVVNYVIPDIYVFKVNDEFVITLNEEGLPRLRISPYYLDLLRSEEAANKAFLNEKLKAATWLIKSIHQRQRTIYKVTESIVKFQKDFLNYGISKLKPLVLKDVAADIGMHESTVSRVTTNKYVHTPQGVFELKFFFSGGIKGGDSEVSSSAVKERIRELIAAESHSDPISDQKIVEILKTEKMELARRTVAKYREMLGIPSSSRRKRIL